MSLLYGRLNRVTASFVVRLIALAKISQKRNSTYCEFGAFDVRTWQGRDRLQRSSAVPLREESFSRNEKWVNLISGR
jgi:hypothetical protein